jgi:transcriptional regulator with XRE-family HTH domain
MFLNGTFQQKEQQMDNGIPMPSFHARLVALRGYTPSRVVAKKIGIKEPTYKAWESGRNEPSIENLAKIARHFGCSGDYLLGLTESVPVTGSNNNTNTGNNSPGAASVNSSCADCALAHTIEKQAAIIERLSSAIPTAQPAPAKAKSRK